MNGVTRLFAAFPTGKLFHISINKMMIILNISKNFDNLMSCRLNLAKWHRENYHQHQ